MKWITTDETWITTEEDEEVKATENSKTALSETAVIDGITYKHFLYLTLTRGIRIWSKATSTK